MSSTDIAPPTLDAAQQQARRLAMIALLLGALAMGISPMLVRFSSFDGIGPFGSAFWRVTLAIPILWGWAKLEERQANAGPRPTFNRPTFYAGLLFAGDLLLWHLAILNTTIANATFFATTAPVFVVLFTWLVLRKRVATATVLGIGLCLLGGVALVGDTINVNPQRLRGDLYGLATAGFFGLYFIAVKDARVFAGAGRLTLGLTLVASPVLLAAALINGDQVMPASMTGWLVLVAMSWVSHAGGQGLLAVALGRLPAIFSSLVIFLEAIAAALIAWAVLGEALSAAQLMGGALILAGIWVARPSPAKS